MIAQTFSASLNRSACAVNSPALINSPPFWIDRNLNDLAVSFRIFATNYRLRFDAREPSRFFKIGTSRERQR
jgi:hypothetical protein